MSQVNASPEALQALMTAIDTFQEDIQAAKTQMEAAVSASADGWNDEVSQRVTGEITEIVNGVNVDGADSVKQTIQTKLSTLEAFLGG
jgi:predicted phage tail protein